jgi:hypothetical protein
VLVYSSRTGEVLHRLDACLWRLRTRPGGLDDSRAHFLSLADELDRL